MSNYDWNHNCPVVGYDPPTGTRDTAHHPLCYPSDPEIRPHIKQQEDPDRVVINRYLLEMVPAPLGPGERKGSKGVMMVLNRKVAKEVVVLVCCKCGNLYAEVEDRRGQT